MDEDGHSFIPLLSSLKLASLLKEESLVLSTSKRAERPSISRRRVSKGGGGEEVKKKWKEKRGEKFSFFCQSRRRRRHQEAEDQTELLMSFPPPQLFFVRSFVRQCNNYPPKLLEGRVNICPLDGVLYTATLAHAM